MDIVGRVQISETRRTLVQGFWRLHRDIEDATAPWLAELPGLDFEARRRTRLLRADLDALGAAPDDEPGDPLPVGSVAEALGVLYVAEGSTLGAQVIRREVAARNGDFTGLAFLDPYGERTGERWRGFLAVLDRMTGRDQEAEASVAGALAGFRHAELRLS